jgi:hypothetical protein
MTRKLIMATLAIVLLPGVHAFAGIITSNSTGTSLSNVNGVGSLGQSVTTPTGGPWDHLSFHFVKSDGTDYAQGTLYLLSQSYSGNRFGLSSGTAGFLASTSTITAGNWVFADNVTIQQNTHYFFYMDSLFLGPEVKFSLFNPYLGGNTFQATGAGNYAATPANDLRFSLNGTEVSAVPEPSTFVSFGTMMTLGGAAYGWRRRKQAVAG